MTTPPLRVEQLLGPYRLVQRLASHREDELWLALDVDDALVTVEYRYPLPGAEYTWLWASAVRARCHEDRVLGVRALYETDARRWLRVSDPPRGVPLDTLARALRAGRGTLPLGVLLTLARDVADAFAALQSLGGRGRALLLTHNTLGADGFEVGFDGVLRYRPTLGVPPDMRGGGPDAPLRGESRWIAPEEALAEERTPSTDVWHVGVALYLLATGQAPFEADNFVAELERLVRVDLQAPSGLPDALYPFFNAIFTREPRDRFAHPGQLATALGDELDRLAPTTREDVASVLAALLPDELAAHRQLREELTAAPPEPRDRDVTLTGLRTPAVGLEDALDTVLHTYPRVALADWATNMP